MSLTIGISTSSSKFNLAIGEEENIIFNSEDLLLNNNKKISFLLSTGLKNSKKTVNEISNIIVDIGPGGTSRVRTGVAFANSLAYSLGISVCPVSSFELIGIQVWEKFKLPIICTVKSIRGSAYIGLYNNKKLILTKHGNIKNIIHKLTETIDEFVITGYHTDIVKDLFPNKKIHECDFQYGNAKILVENSNFFSKKAISFPSIAIPITEQTCSD